MRPEHPRHPERQSLPKSHSPVYESFPHRATRVSVCGRYLCATAPLPRIRNPGSAPLVLHPWFHARGSVPLVPGSMPLVPCPWFLVPYPWFCTRFRTLVPHPWFRSLVPHVVPCPRQSTTVTHDSNWYARNYRHMSNTDLNNHTGSCTTVVESEPARGRSRWACDSGTKECERAEPRGKRNQGVRESGTTWEAKPKSTGARNHTGSGTKEHARAEPHGKRNQRARESRTARRAEPRGQHKTTGGPTH